MKLSTQFCTSCQACYKTATVSPAPCNSSSFQKVHLNLLWSTLLVHLNMGPMTAGLLLTILVSGLKLHSPQMPQLQLLVFLTSVFACEGNPCTITTINGPQFTSTAFTYFLTERCINHMKTSVYHPQQGTERLYSDSTSYSATLKNCSCGTTLQLLGYLPCYNWWVPFPARQREANVD